MQVIMPSFKVERYDDYSQIKNSFDGIRNDTLMFKLIDVYQKIQFSQAPTFLIG